MGAKANRQWGRVVIIGTGYWVKVFSLIFDSSVGLSAGIQSAGDPTLVRILHSAAEVNLSLFGSKIACLHHSIEINNNKLLYSYGFSSIMIKYCRHPHDVEIRKIILSPPMVPFSSMWIMFLFTVQHLKKMISHTTSLIIAIGVTVV